MYTRAIITFENNDYGAGGRLYEVELYTEEDVKQIQDIVKFTSGARACFVEGYPGRTTT